MIDAILFRRGKAMQLIFDNRVSPSHSIRINGRRRKNKVLFHLLKLPVKDSDGNLVFFNRRTAMIEDCFK
jgi:hypothetical protein